MKTAKGYAAQSAKSALGGYEYQLPDLGPQDVLIKVSHCGICHSDIHLIDNDWGMSVYPFVPGHEVVGTIEAKGSLVRHLEIGQRVGVGWQSGSCLTCEWCMTGYENQCAQQTATCVGRNGGFAEYLVTHSHFAFGIPDNLQSENAAPLMCGGITVYSPLRLFDIKSYQHVGVIGIGGLGHLAIQFASAMGCKVTAFSTTASKEAEARQFGAHQFIVSTDMEQMKSLANSIDLILCTINVSQDWSLYLQMLRPNGRLNFLGPIFEPINVPPLALIFGQKSLSGTGIGSRGMIQEMLHFAARHNIQAQTELMPAAQVNEAIQKVKENKARYRMVLAF